MIKQTLILLLLASAIALGVNLVSPNAIPLVGEYRDLSTGEGPIVPPTASEGDPPFIDLSEAHLTFATGTALFVDARDEEEFNCGTIPGSVCIPFEYLPDEGDLGLYFDSTLGNVDRSSPLVVFCSGEECDLSLHLGRNLQMEGYTDVRIFFGGAREWELAELEVERRTQCE